MKYSGVRLLLPTSLTFKTTFISNAKFDSFLNLFLHFLVSTSILVTVCFSIFKVLLGRRRIKCSLIAKFYFISYISVSFVLSAMLNNKGQGQSSCVTPSHHRSIPPYFILNVNDRKNRTLFVHVFLSQIGINVQMTLLLLSP